MDKTIWVLGSYHDNADKSIMWVDPFPNFSNCDLLIINLQTLNKELLQKYTSKLLNEGRKYIFDLLMTGEKDVIFVLTADEASLTWLPAYPDLNKIASADIGEYNVEPYLEDYMKNVENCEFYIRSFYYGFFVEMTDPKSRYHENYPFTQDILTWTFRCLQRIENQAKQSIGGYYKYVLFKRPMLTSRGPEMLHFTGNLIFLPPPTKTTAEQGIDLIINNLLRKKLKESPPEWEKEIDLPGLRNIKQKITEMEDEKKRIIVKIENLKKEKNKKIIFRRLLWTKGAPLEEIVRDAFVFLGFPEIQKIRSKEREDWVFEFKTISIYQYGVLEVKGADKRTALSDLTQCNKWVEDYMLEKIGKAKGIFIPNQYRLENIKKSIKKREHFEPNELEYAKKREICILPAHEVFKAVAEKMKNNLQVTRENIEQRLASANGLCKLI